MAIPRRSPLPTSLAMMVTLVSVLLLSLGGCSSPATDALPLVAVDQSEPADREQDEPEADTGLQSTTSQANAASGLLDPGELLRSMALPVDVTIPDGVQLSAIQVGVSRDETRREIYGLTIEVTSDQPPTDLINTLTANSVLPRRGIDISLPAFDHFYDWSDPSVWVEPDGSGSSATISTSTRRQTPDAGNGIIPSPATALLQQVADERGLPMWSSGSSLRWAAADPNLVQASLSFTGADRDRSEVTNWLRAHSQPGAFQSAFAVSERDDRIDGSIETVLAGQPQATAVWRGGSYLDTMSIRFNYEIDDNGLPLSDQAVAVAPALQTLISFGSSWRVDDDGVADDGWAELDFDDAAWGIDSAPLVRDEPLRDAGWIATPASGDPAWFRHPFDLGDPATIAALELSFFADDAAVIYLNGAELHRWNLQDGPVDAETWALSRISGEDEEVLHVVGGLPPDLLRPGRNVLSVALIQASSSSSDARFDAQLIAWPIED